MMLKYFPDFWKSVWVQNYIFSIRIIEYNVFVTTDYVCIYLKFCEILSRHWFVQFKKGPDQWTPKKLQIRLIRFWRMSQFIHNKFSIASKVNTAWCTVDRIEIYLTIMDMAGSISIFDNLYRNFDELKIFEKFYDITWQPQFPQMIQKSLQWTP